MATKLTDVEYWRREAGRLRGLLSQLYAEDERFPAWSPGFRISVRRALEASEGPAYVTGHDCRRCSELGLTECKC